MATGIVKWYNVKKGYGFIIPDDKSADVFVHFSEILSEKKFKVIHQDDKVEFELVLDATGRQAHRVKVLEAAPKHHQHSYSTSENKESKTKVTD